MSRVAPSPDHLDYLQRIGVDLSATTAAVSPLPDSAGAAPCPQAGAPVRLARRPGLPRLWRLSRKQLSYLLLVVLLVAAALLVAWVMTSDTADAAEPEPTPFPGVIRANAALDRFVHGQREVTAKAAPPAEQTTAASGNGADSPIAARPTPRAEAPKDAAKDTAAPRLEVPARAASRALPWWSLEALGIFALVAVAGATLFCQGHLDGRVRLLEAALLGADPSARARQLDPESPPSDRPPASDPPGLYTADSPERAFEALVATVSARGLSPLPRATEGAWGIASVAGNVRADNQDAAIAFELGSAQVFVVADGLGGLPRGQEAARLAVGRAALSAAVSLAATPGALARPQLVASSALLDAAAALGARALADGFASGRDGFRTTLIVIVATPHAYGYAHVGDGGGIVLRASGATETLVVPQKSGGLANVVGGSLGPTLQGTPAVGLAERQAGDVLLLGTDGVFDRVPDTFAATVADALAEHAGDAQRVASLAVTDLAAAVDGSGYVCDDNLTLGILRTPMIASVADRRRTASAGRG